MMGLLAFESDRLPRATLSLLASGIGPLIPKNVIETIHKDRISHLNFHANFLEYLGFCDDKLSFEGDSTRLEYLEHLDVSSNKLGKKLIPYRKVISILCMSCNLVHLNLATNEITSDSLAHLFHHGEIRLHGLRSLDLSHNLLLCLPSAPAHKKATNQNQGSSVIGTSCPNLETLILIDNRIRDLAKLLDALSPLNRVLKRLRLQNNTQNKYMDVKECPNLVCTQKSYREKLIHLLSNLLELDGFHISKDERESSNLSESVVVTNTKKIESLKLSGQYNNEDDLHYPISTKMGYVDTATPASHLSHLVKKSCHSPVKDMTDFIHMQSSSMSKLKDLASHIDNLTDLTQKHVEVSRLLVNSSSHNKPCAENCIMEDPLGNQEEAQTQTSFSIPEIMHESPHAPAVENQTTVIDRLSWALLVIFTIQYSVTLVKDEQYRIALKRLKHHQRKCSQGWGKDCHLKESTLTCTTTDITSNGSDSTERRSDLMQTEIYNLTKKLEDSEEQRRSNALKYQKLKSQEKDLKRSLSKAQESENELKKALWSNQNQIALIEQSDNGLMNSLREVQERCKAQSDQLSQEKLMHLMDIQQFENVIARYRQENRHLKSTVESLVKKSTVDKAKRINLQQVVQDTESKLKDKMLEIDKVKGQFLQETNKNEVIEKELIDCRKALKESKEVMDESNKKQIESQDGILSSTLRLEQIDIALHQTSTELEIIRDKYKRKVEKLHHSEIANKMLAEELEKVTIKAEEQRAYHEQLIEKQNNELNMLHKDMALSEEAQKTEMDRLRYKIKDMDENQRKEVERHHRDATENVHMLQRMEAEMDRLKRQIDKQIYKRERAEHQVQMLAQELEHERQSNHALHEKLKEINKAHESQYGKAKTFLENAYNEITRPNNQ